MNWQMSIIYICRFVFVINSIVNCCVLRFEKLPLLLGSLLLTFIPEIYMKFFKVRIPIVERTIFTVFLLCSQWLGSYLGFYTSFGWWDVFLHTSSGFIVGYVGLIILVTIDGQLTLFKCNQIKLIVVFVFMTAITGAAIWEIFEFSSDFLLGTNTQLGSLQDTMEDIICGTVSGALYALYIGWRLKSKRKCCIDRLLTVNQETSKDK